MFFKFACIKTLFVQLCVNACFINLRTDLVVKANGVHVSYPVLNLMERACCYEQMECICLLIINN